MAGNVTMKVLVNFVANVNSIFIGKEGSDMNIGIIIVVVIMAVSMSMGFGLMISLPVVMIHVLPPVLLLLSFNYIGQFIKEKGKGFMQRGSTGIMVSLLWWMTFDSCKILGNYSNHGTLPELHLDRIPWILGIYGTVIVVGGVAYLIRKLFKMYPRRSYGHRYHNYR